jgi:hypothetical protein
MELKLITPHKNQKELIKAALDPDYFFIVGIIGRQFGKSVALMNIALYWALQDKGCSIYWVSPTDSQLQKVYTEIIDAVIHTNIIKAKKATKGDTDIQFTNGSRIFFKSAAAEDSLRGGSVNYMIIDEAAFVKQETIETILLPMLAVRGKKCCFISTPKGKNYLYSLSVKGQDPHEKSYLYLKGSSYDTPFITKDELDEARRSLPEDIFKQEIMGEFIDSGGEVFVDIDRYCVVDHYEPPRQGVKYYAGVDFGRQDDYSVLTIFDDTGKLVYFYRERQKPWGEILGNIERELKRYDALCQVEVNSIGDVLFEQLKQRYKNVLPFQTTNASKQNIIEDFIYGTNEGQIFLPTERLNPELYLELKTFSYEYSLKTRKISYGAIQGAHDDIIMSLCIGYNTLKERKTKGTYYIY